MHDLIIIGGGPAGVAAAVYAARKKIKTLMVTESFGGQSIVSPSVENWIGDIKISGLDLAKKLEAHARRYEKDGDLEIWSGDLVEKIRTSGVPRTPDVRGFTIQTKFKKSASTKAILVCSGSRRRRLGIPGEDKLDGKGVAWCATCDAPLFAKKTVAIIGGGNVGLETALTLHPYVKKLYLIQRSNKLKGDLVTQKKVLTLPKLTTIFNASTTKILGDKRVSGLHYQDNKTNKEKTLDVGGVFVAIGSAPNTEFIKKLIKTNKWGEIIINHKTQQASTKGIWAAGDVTDVRYKQNNISAGDAIKATLNISDYFLPNFIYQSPASLRA